MISAIFTPILWALAGTGLLKAFVAAAVTFGWLDATSSTYVILNALSDALINFLPMALAITAGRYFKASEFTSFAIAGALVYPSIVALNGQPDITFFGIPVTMVSYVSSVIPIIVIVWLQSYAERFLLKVLPGAVKRFLTPMIVVALAVPLVFLAIGPLSSLIGGGLASAIGWVFQTVPWLGGAIMGGLWQVFVIFGLHWGLVPLFQLELQTTGARAFAQQEPPFARRPGDPVGLPRRHHRARDLRHQPAAQAPLRLRHRRRCARWRAHRDGRGLLEGLRRALRSRAPRAARQRQHGHARHRSRGRDHRPVPPHGHRRVRGSRTVVPLSEVPDAAFADASLGKGVAIRPTSGAVYAPFDGTVVAAFPTGHAIGLRGVDGVELLIHVGLDTVKLGGEHFSLKVQSGTEVKAGDLLLEFDGDAIEKAGYNLITPVIVTNGDLYPDVADAASGPLSHGETLFRAVSVDSLSATR
ncbi:MAG: phosphotransferase system component, glucose/maltose/N-acetylglucosamine-specific [Microbacterium sp.]|nr:phosphotransferase system component, glucose/maltose/N-acetylglucosamine-specific [Microbacterium sp.]